MKGHHHPPARAPDPSAGTPHLATIGSTRQLIVDGKPYLVLGGELHNRDGEGHDIAEAAVQLGVALAGGPDRPRVLGRQHGRSWGRNSRTPRSRARCRSGAAAAGAACFSRLTPTGVEPVNDSSRRHGSRMIGSDTAEDAVVGDIDDARGTPASSSSLAKYTVVSGVSAAGLITAGHPQHIGGGWKATIGLRGFFDEKHGARRAGCDRGVDHLRLSDVRLLLGRERF